MFGMKHGKQTLGQFRQFCTRTGAGLVFVLMAQSALAGERTLDYQVAWGHMSLAQAQVSLKQSDDSYRLASTGWTEGLLDFFVSWQGKAETNGRVEDGVRQPLSHVHEGQWDDRTRWTRVAWDDPGAPQTETRPAPDLEEVTPVPDGTLSQTIDPLTLMLSVMDQLAATGRCEGEGKLWDGRRRYDLAVVHLGTETLEPDRPWGYAGEAVLCTFKINRIGGFWRDSEDWREAERKSDTPARIWVAEVTPGAWAPVRAEVETPYGTVVGRLLPEGGLDSDS